MRSLIAYVLLLALIGDVFCKKLSKDVSPESISSKESKSSDSSSSESSSSESSSSESSSSAGEDSSVSSNSSESSSSSESSDSSVSNEDGLDMAIDMLKAKPYPNMLALAKLNRIKAQKKAATAAP